MNSSQVAETQFLDVPGGRLAYDVTGPDDAALVLCVAGMGDIRQAFRFLAPTLVEAGYRVACMDQRGHGESSSGWASYGSPATGEDMLALIRHLGGPATIIGHSSSAAAAVWAAAEEPSWSAPSSCSAPSPGNASSLPVLRLAEKIVTGSPLIWSRLYYPSLYKAAKPADFTEYLRAMRASLREPGRMAATRGAMSRRAGVCRARLPELALPGADRHGHQGPRLP